MAIYQHETIDVAAGKVREYLDALGEVFAPIGAERRMPFVGVFQVAATSGRWPQVIVIMEIADWATYAWQRSTSPTHPQMERWKSEALRYRTGGFDHMLTLLPFSTVPSAAPQIASSGRVFLQHTYVVRPGCAAAFADAARDHLVPRAAEWHAQLEAFWHSTFHPTNHIALWSVAGWDAFARLQEERDHRVAGGLEPIPGLELAWDVLEDVDERLLMPAAFSPLGGGEQSLVVTI